METPYFNGGGNRLVVKHKRAGLIQKRMYEASHKYRFYPTSAQRTYLAQTFGCVRVVYNKALEERERTYSNRQGAVVQRHERPSDTVETTAGVRLVARRVVRTASADASTPLHSLPAIL